MNKNFLKKTTIITLSLISLMVTPVRAEKHDIVNVNTAHFQSMITELEQKVEMMKNEKKDLIKMNEQLKENLEVFNYNTVDLGTFRSTAYDLSVQSCGKPIGHRLYGITASGYSLKDKTRESAMAVAVDPKVIPLGTKLYIEFDEEYSHFNGVYTAVDTGGAIKGKRIDLFMGDFKNNKASAEAMRFGVRDVKVYKIVE